MAQRSEGFHEEEAELLGIEKHYGVRARRSGLTLRRLVSLGHIAALYIQYDNERFTGTEKLSTSRAGVQ